MPVSDHIDNVPRVASFNPVAPTTNFPLPFPVYEADDQTELKNDFLVTLAGNVVTNYTVTGTFLDGVSINAQVVFSPGITGALVIYSRRKPRSGEDVANGRGVTGSELNSLLNGLTASIRDVYDWLGRLESGIGVPPGSFLSTAGGTMLGAITLPGAPSNALHAATKAYVDGKLPAIGTNGKRLIADSGQASGMRFDWDSGTRQTLVYAAAIAWDMSAADDAIVTLAGNGAFNLPTGIAIGRKGLLYVVQGGAGNFAPTWDAAFIWPGGVVQRPQRDIGSITCYEWYVNAAAEIHIRKRWVSGREEAQFYREIDMGAYALSSAITQAHGLGVRPKFVKLFLECTTAQAPYAVGDRVPADNIQHAAGAAVTVRFNATSVIANTHATAPHMGNAAGAYITITPASWKLIAQVFEP